MGGNTIMVSVNLNTSINSTLDIQTVAKKVGDEIARDIERRLGVF